MFEVVGQRFGRDPDLVTLTFPEASAKTLKYSKNSVRLVNGLKLCSGLSFTWTATTASSWDFLLECSCDDDMLEIHVVEYDGAKELVAEFLGDAVVLCSPVYGIGYEMPYVSGPRGYARGVSERSEEAPAVVVEELERFQEVLQDCNRQFDHCFREVYPTNIISDTHLKLPVGQATLEEWIEGEEVGSLVQVGEGIWNWTIADRTSALRARKLLLECNYILAPFEIGQ